MSLNVLARLRQLLNLGVLLVLFLRHYRIDLVPLLSFGHSARQLGLHLFQVVSGVLVLRLKLHVLRRVRRHFGVVLVHIVVVVLEDLHEVFAVLSLCATILLL